MRADSRFLAQPKQFWANVRSISQELGYTKRTARRASGSVRVHTVKEMCSAMESLGLTKDHLVVGGRPTALGRNLETYFDYRARILNEFVEPRLMNAEKAKKLFKRLRMELKPKCALPMNKQKGEKREHAYLTGIVNMLIEQSVGGLPIDFNPLDLTTFTANGAPLRTLSRRVDGAFPHTVDPIGIWEIKEYYFTTSFGSRIADGVYETQLDGMELEELRESERVSVEHLLIVDAYDTWWLKGRSYLCRIIDMLHMGLVDEVLFGREVIEVLPKIIRTWKTTYRARAKGL